MKKVKAKKHLGQHFLKDEAIAHRISELIAQGPSDMVIEIGPGMGVLTKYLLEQPGKKIHVAEVDDESVTFLRRHFPELDDRIHHEDFLTMDLNRFKASIDVIGNFPYNISSPILFHVLEHKDCIPFLAGMFQKEVAQRVCSGPGNKSFGILSVLLQVWYDTTYHFDVPPDVFDPPPKVDSGVMSMRRNERQGLPIPYTFFKAVVKTAFNQRRKTMHNSLKSLHQGQGLSEAFSRLRPEALDVDGFIRLAEELYAKQAKDGADQ